MLSPQSSNLPIICTGYQNFLYLQKFFNLLSCTKWEIKYHFRGGSTLYSWPTIRLQTFHRSNNYRWEFKSFPYRKNFPFLYMSQTNPHEYEGNRAKIGTFIIFDVYSILWRPGFTNFSNLRNLVDQNQFIRSLKQSNLVHNTVKMLNWSGM